MLIILNSKIHWPYSESGWTCVRRQHTLALKLVLGIIVAHIFALNIPKTHTNKRHINRCVIYARISMRTDHLIHYRQPSKTPRHTDSHYVVIILQWIVFCFVLKIILSSSARTEVDSQQDWSQLEILFKHQNVLITCAKYSQACIWGGTEAGSISVPGHIRSFTPGKCIRRVKDKHRKMNTDSMSLHYESSMKPV